MTFLWGTRRLEDLVDFHDRERIPLSKRERAGRSGPYPYYGAQGVIDHIDEYIFDGRYLLVAEDGENLNSRKLPIAQIAAGQFWVNNHAHIIRARAGIADDDFLQAAIEFHPLGGLVTGAAQPKLSQANLKRMELIAPPFEEQRRIGTVLRTMADLIENNRRRIEILEEMARLIYREWFVHFRFPGHEDVELVDSALGPIPAGWEVVAVGDAVETVGGGTPSKKNPAYWESPTITWYTPSDLTKASSMFAFESADCINELGLKKSSARLFPARTVMMTSRATIGVISIAATEAATNQGFISCVPNGRLSEFHLYCWLRENVELFLTLASGATFKELRKSTFRELPIVVPPEPVEDAFRAVVGPMCELVANLTRQNRVLAEARDLLLPRLISGELDVSDLDLDVDLPTPTRVESVA